MGDSAGGPDGDERLLHDHVPSVEKPFGGLWPEIAGERENGCRGVRLDELRDRVAGGCYREIGLGDRLHGGSFGGAAGSPNRLDDVGRPVGGREHCDVRSFVPVGRLAVTHRDRLWPTAQKTAGSWQRSRAGDGKRFISAGRHRLV